MRKALALVLLALALSGCATSVGDEGVRIEYYSHGPLFVEPGGRLEIDVKVVDAASGQPLLAYPVDAAATGGALTEGNDRGQRYYRFQADRDLKAPYTISFTADSASGSDTVTLRLEAGWAFTDAAFTSHLEGNLPEIGESWSGRVCGDPFGEWTVDRVITETDVQNFDTVAVTPRPLDDRGDQQFGGVLMIAANPGVRDGEAPFALYLDDVSPEDFVPAAQRVDVVLEPLSAEECS